MRNVINYYYQMNIENIHLTNGIYYFTYQNHSYLFAPVWRDPFFIQAVFDFTKKNLPYHPYYHEIILTKDGLPYLFIDQKNYALLKTKNLIYDAISFYDLKMLPVEVESSFSTLLRFPWISLWMEKCDYLEEVIHHLEKKYYTLLPIFYWFLGLSENAIQYVNATLLNGKKTGLDRMVVSHSRIDVKMSVFDFYNPFSIVIDHPARDVSEYLKSLFYHNDYQIEEIEEYLFSLNFSDFGYSLLYGRLLFPTFFFDLCDRFFNDQLDKKELFLLGDRMEEYRNFLKEIYFILRKKTYLEEVRWITRN